MIFNNCLNCEHEFQTWECKVASGRGKFCSKDCYYESKKGKPSGLKGMEFPERCGENNHFFGKKHSDESIEKMRQANLGKRLSPETEFKTGNEPWNKGEKCPWLSERNSEWSGEKSPNWKGGLISQNTRDRWCLEYGLWRTSVFKRDDYTCQNCEQRGGNLNAHHILNFAQYKELRFAIDNGITLCKGCHLEFHQLYGRKNNNEEQIMDYLASTGEEG